MPPFVDPHEYWVFRHPSDFTEYTFLNLFEIFACAKMKKTVGGF
jgi:hypothetical protein